MEIHTTVSAAQIPRFPLSALATAADDTPWVPLAEGKAIKPLRFFRGDRGYVGLLRVDPDIDVPLHRHTGEVHAFNLQGFRDLHTGERIGPGGYVYEPAGNVDSWRAVGDEPMVVLVVVRGAVEHLDAAGAVIHTHDARGVRELYLKYCSDNGIVARNLVE